MHLNQDPTNVAAHGMSSAEANKYRQWNADPENLLNTFDIRVSSERHTAPYETSNVPSVYQSVVARDQGIAEARAAIQRSFEVY